MQGSGSYQIYRGFKEKQCMFYCFFEKKYLKNVEFLVVFSLLACMDLQ